MTEPAAAPPAPATSTVRDAATAFRSHHAASGGPGLLALAVMCLLLSGVSGLLGAFTVLYVRPLPAAPRLAVLDTTKIAEAVAEAAMRDEGIVQRFPRRFEDIIQKLQAADPDRVILVREAVVGSDLDDLTPLVLQEVRGEAPSSRRPHAR